MQFIKDTKMLLFIALPLLFSRMMDMAIFFVGFILIAKLGPTEFAASSLASTTYVAIMVIAMGIIYAMGIKMSQAYGEKNEEKIRGYFYSAILLSILLAIIGMAIIVLISNLLPYLGQRPVIIPIAKKAMEVFCIPMLPTLLTIVINQLVTVLLKPRIVFFTSIINAVLTIICFYSLMFGHFGMPALKIEGFGLSLLIGNIAVILITVIYVLQEQYFKKFHLFKFTNIRKQLIPQMIDIIRLGFPMGIQFGAEIMALAVTTFLIGTFGEESLIAAQVAQQIIVIALVVPFTLSEATSILIGQEVGKKNIMAIKSYGFSSQAITLLILTVVSFIFIIYPRVLTGIYLDLNNPKTASIIALSTTFLYVAAITQLFDGLRNVTAGALRALNDSIYPMYTGIFAIWFLGLPIGILLAFYERLGPIGFPIGATIGLLVGSVVLFVRFYNKAQKGFILSL